jgi:hypothetical protein
MPEVSGQCLTAGAGWVGGCGQVGLEKSVRRHHLLVLLLAGFTGLGE